jgi:hypothetical protein
MGWCMLGIIPCMREVVFMPWAFVQWCLGQWAVCSDLQEGAASARIKTPFVSLTSPWVKDAELHRKSPQVRDNQEAKVSSLWWTWHTHAMQSSFGEKDDPLLWVTRKDTFLCALLSTRRHTLSLITNTQDKRWCQRNPELRIHLSYVQFLSPIF